MTSPDYKNSKEYAERYPSIHKIFQEILLIVKKILAARHNTRKKPGEISPLGIFWVFWRFRIYREQKYREKLFTNFSGSISFLAIHVLYQPEIHLEGDLEKDRVIILTCIRDHYEAIKKIYPNWQAEYSFLDNAFYNEELDMVTREIKAALMTYYKLR